MITSFADINYKMTIQGLKVHMFKGLSANPNNNLMTRRAGLSRPGCIHPECDLIKRNHLNYSVSLSSLNFTKETLAIVYPQELHLPKSNLYKEFSKYPLMGTHQLKNLPLIHPEQ